MKIPSFYGSNEWNGKAEFHKLRAEWRKNGEMRNNSAKSGMVGMSEITTGLLVLATILRVNSAFHPSGVGKSSTGLSGWGKTGCVHLCQVAGNTV